MNTEQTMTVASSRRSTERSQSSVRENVAQELSHLRDDLWRIAEDVRMKAKGASTEIQSTRQALEREVQRFSDQIKDAADDTQDDLKQVGEDLRMRLQKLANQIAMPAS